MNDISLNDGVEITLLSVEEYENMCEHIPHLNYWWWLRSPGYDQRYAAGVDLFGDVYYGGGSVSNDYGAVRPALKSDVFKKENIGTEFAAFGNRWTVCGEGFAISDCEISFRRFDAKSNDYETSEVKKFLKEWISK